MESDNTLPMPEFDEQEDFSRQNETITPPYYAVPPKPPLLLNKFLRIALGILAVLLVVILVIVFIIGRSKTASNGSANGEVLIYWGVLEDSSVMQAVISGFEKENPNIKVEYVQQDIQDYQNRLTTRINNGRGPDVFSFYNSWLPELSNFILPLPGTTISVKDFSSSYYPVVTNDLVKNGSVYGVPLGIDTLALYINNSMFKAAGLAPPSNWDDFSSDATTLTVKDTTGKIKTAGAAIGTYDNVDYAPDILSLLFVQNGVDLNNLSQNEKRIEDTLNFYTSFVTNPNTNVWDGSLDSSTLAFSKGNLAMYFGYSRDFPKIKAYNPTLDFKVVNVPQLTGQDTTIAGYWAEGVSAKTTHKDQALAFIKYLAREDVEDKLYTAELKAKSFATPYAKVNMAARFTPDSNVYPFVSQAKYATSSYFAFGTYDTLLNKQANDLLQVTINSILNGTQTPENSAASLVQGITQVLGLYK